MNGWTPTPTNKERTEYDAQRLELFEARSLAYAHQTSFPITEADHDKLHELIVQCDTDPQMIGWNSRAINWHNRIIFDVPAMVENTAKRMQPLKARIDARMSEAAQRAREAFHHK